MNAQDQFIEAFMVRKKSFLNKEKEIINNFMKYNVEIDVAVNKWNSAISDAMIYQPPVQSNIRAIKEFTIIFEIFEEFNRLYIEEGNKVSMHFEGDLFRIHNCVSQIRDRFDIIQRNGSDISKSLYIDLENLIFLMRKVVVVFEMLIEKSHLRSWIMEQRDQHEFRRINNERMMLEIKHLEETKKMDDKIILEREHEIEREEKRQKIQEEIARNNEDSIKRSIYVRTNAQNMEKSVLGDGGYTEMSNSITTSGESARSSNRVEDVFADMWRTNKAYCHNIRKTVNNICSQITNSNPQHTINRLKEILKFLHGDSIPLIGPEKGIYIDLKQHRDAPDLFWHLFYRAVLIQAETQFAVNIETTVAFASLTASLFGSFPDRLDGLLNLICEHYPVFAARITSLDAGDQFLVSLKGVARFVAALEVALPPPGFKGCEGLSPAKLWSCLANLEACQIQECVWAEAVNGLLEMGGESLWRLYGQQFSKMLVALCNKVHLLPGISEIALELMIDDVLSKKSFQVQGYLSPESWQ